MPSGKLTVCELEHGPVEIVDLPIDSMVIFQFAKCKRLPEGTLIDWWKNKTPKHMAQI